MTNTNDNNGANMILTSAPIGLVTDDVADANAALADLLDDLDGDAFAQVMADLGFDVDALSSVPTLAWGDFGGGRDLTPEQDSASRLNLPTGESPMQVTDLETGQVIRVTLPDVWGMTGGDLAIASVEAMGGWDRSTRPQVDYHQDGLLVAGRFVVSES